MDWPDLTYSLSPTWPTWLPQGAALPAFLGAAALLAVLTFWTYLGQRGSSVQRIVVAVSGPGRGEGLAGMQHFTYKLSTNTYEEERLFRGVHPMMAERLHL